MNAPLTKNDGLDVPLEKIFKIFADPDGVVTFGLGEVEVAQYLPAEGRVRQWVKNFKSSDPNDDKSRRHSSPVDVSALEFVIPGVYERGVSKEQFRGSDILFIESDSKSLDEQRQVRSWLRDIIGYEVISCFSGGKSIHIFFKLDRPLTPEEWLMAERALLMLYGGDPAVASLGRRMRLPGGTREKDEVTITQTIETFNPDSVLPADLTIATLLDELAYRGITEDMLSDDAWREYKRVYAGSKDSKQEEILAKFVIEWESKPLNAYEWENAAKPIKGIPNVLSETEKAIALVQQREPGTGTYDTIYFPMLCALVNVCGTEEAIRLARLACPDEIKAWGQPVAEKIKTLNVRENGYGLATLQRIFRQFGYKGCLIEKESVSLEQVRLLKLKTRQKNRESLASLRSLDQADVVLNKRYLPSDAIPTDKPFVVVKSLKGTGKTEVLTPVVKKAVAPVLYMVHTTTLTKGTGNRLGLLSQYDLLNASVEGAETIRAEMAHKGFAMCSASLHRKSAFWGRFGDLINWARKTQPIVILDEFMQVLWELLSNEQRKKNRIEICENLAGLMREASQVIVLDADMCNYGLKLLRSLIDHEPHIILNEWVPEPGSRQATIMPSQKILLTHLFESLDKGKKVLIQVDSQSVESELSAQNLKRLIQGKYPHLKIGVLDSEQSRLTDSETFDPLGGEGIDSLVIQFDVVIATPVIGTGVSIDVKGHFSAVYGICFGALTTEGVCQFLARLREDVPRYLWVTSTSGVRIGCGSCTPAELLQTTDKRAQELLSELSARTFNPETGKPMLTDSSSGMMLFWAERGASINSDADMYAEVVREGLRADGYLVSDLDPSMCTHLNADDDELEDLLKANKELAIEEFANKVAEATLLSSSEYERLQKQTQMTSLEKASVQKTYLHHCYGVAVTPELVKRDLEGDYYKKLRLHYALTEGRQFLKSHEADRISKGIHGGMVLSHDVVSNNLYEKVRLLEELGFLRLLSSLTNPFTAEDPLCCEFLKRAKQPENRKRINVLFNRSLSDKSKALSYLNALLPAIGYASAKGTRKRIDGELMYVYSIDHPDDNRDLIFAEWFNRDSAKHKPQSHPAMFEQMLLAFPEGGVPNFPNITSKSLEHFDLEVSSCECKKDDLVVITGKAMQQASLQETEAVWQVVEVTADHRVRVRSEVGERAYDPTDLAILRTA